MSVPSDFSAWVTLIALGVLLVLGVLVGVWLLIGLFQARSLVRREFTSYFLSPIAYVVLVVFLAVTGHLFYLTLGLLTASNHKGVEYPMQMLLGDERFWLVFLFIPPLLTMRLFAEERSSGTLEMLMTAPLRDWQVVLSKYLACFAFYVMLWLPTLAYLPILLHLQEPQVQWVVTPWTITLLVGLGAIVLGALFLLPRLGSAARLGSLLLLLGGGIAFGVGLWGHYHGLNVAGREYAADTEHLLVMPVGQGFDVMPVLSSYLGLMLAGAMFLAIGILVSSLIRSQMVAALISLVLCLLFIVVGFWRPDLDSGGPVYRVLFFFSVPDHFRRDFARGIVDSRHLVLYGSVALFCLFLTVRSLESRRWR
jgi:ABC-type transport system involved in multi-copper enzyme maturation permease subunit